VSVGQQSWRFLAACPPAEPASMIGPSKYADRDLRRAWVAVALLPVALVLAMVVGEGLISVLGYQSGS
jgi:hypothetical protein